MAKKPHTTEGKVITAASELLQRYDTLFGISKNVARAIPNVKDGLKPVQRKILYTLNEMGKVDDFKKVGSIIGEVLKIYSHGDVSVAQALIRMGTTWGNIVPYITSHGNFGCHDSDTEVRTKDGWKRFEEITKEDYLMSVDPIDSVVIWEQPTKIFKYEYEGEMIHGKDQVFDFMVTPNHRMLVYDMFDSFYSEFIEADKLHGFVRLGTMVDNVFGSENVVWTHVFATKVSIERVSYKGYVYCAEVPTFHTLVTRRNGHTLISGNSKMCDAPAAPRYIEAKLSPFARMCYFTDKLCIDMIPTYDNTRMEPETLPSMFPTVVVNGVIGTGYGHSSNVCQYNLKDVIETMTTLINDPQAKCRLLPDSQWGCRIMSGKPFGKYRDTFDQIFETGYGSIVYKFQYKIDHLKNEVVVTALPPSIPLEDVLKEIERLQNERKYFPELKSMTDYSGKDHDDGVYVVFKLLEGKNPYRFVKKLETVNGFCKTFSVNVDLVDGLDVLHYSIRSYLLTWYQYRKDYIRACLSTELTNLESDIAINDIKLFIFDKDHLDKTVEIYRSSKDHADIITKLMQEYSKSTGMTSQQAAILSEMAGKDYTKSALARYRELKIELQQKYDDLTTTLNDPNGIPNIIKEQLRRGLKFARPRGSKIISKDDLPDASDEKIILCIRPENGTIAKLQENEHSNHLIASLPSELTASMDPNYNAIIFDNRGRYVILNPGQIPLMDNLNTVPLNRYADRELGPLVAMAALDDSCTSFVVITKLGKMKKINPKNYQTKRNNIYITLDDGDEVISVIGVKNEECSVIVYTDQGNGQRLPVNSIQVTSASANGQYMFNVPEGEHIVGGFLVKNTENLLVYVTRKGSFRANQSKHFLLRKTKNDWVHMMETSSNANRVVSVLNCSSKDTIRIVFNDLTSMTIPVSEIPVVTMNTTPKSMIDCTGKSILQAKVIKEEKKNSSQKK